MTKKLTGIPEFHQVLTDTGWVFLRDVTIDTTYMTLVDGKVMWQKQNVFTKFIYTGLLDVTTVWHSIYAKEEAFLENYLDEDFGTTKLVGSSLRCSRPTSSFFTKGFDVEFKTYNSTHKVVSASKEIYSGFLFYFSFETPCNICISDKKEYFLLDTKTN